MSLALRVERTSLGSRLRGNDTYSVRISARIGAGSAAASASSRVSHTSPGASARGGHECTATRCGTSVRRKCVKPCSIGASSAPAATCAREARAAVRDDVGVDRQLGQAPQPAPDAGRRALLEQDRSRALEHEHAHRALRQRLLRPRRRQLGDAICQRARRNRARPDTRRSAARFACTPSRRDPSAPACRSPHASPAAAPRPRATASPRLSARRASRRCRDAARARASRCRRGSPRARRTRTRRSRPRSSGRCRASVAIVAASRGNSPPCCATTAFAAACR